MSLTFLVKVDSGLFVLRPAPAFKTRDVSAFTRFPRSVRVSPPS